MNDDPLAQLRDIRLPEPAGWWPPAPGWWLLALLVLAALGLCAYLLYRQHQNNAYRRSAQAELENAWARLEQDGDREAYATALSQILRRAARVVDPQAAQLHGQNWLEFLDASSGSNRFSQGPGKQLLVLPYRPPKESDDLNALHKLALDWLATHRRIRSRPREGLRRAAV